MTRKVYVLTNCDGEPCRVIGDKEMADFAHEDDMEVCGVSSHLHELFELDLEYEYSRKTKDYTSDQRKWLRNAFIEYGKTSKDVNPLVRLEHTLDTMNFTNSSLIEKMSKKEQLQCLTTLLEEVAE